MSRGLTGLLRRMLGSVRLRSAGAAALIVGTTFGLSSIALMSHLRQNVVANAQATASVRANDAATLLTDGHLPRSWSVPDDKSSFVQVVQGSRLIAATSNLHSRPVVFTADPDHSRTISGVAVDPDAPFRVLDIPVIKDGTRYSIVAGSSMDDAQDNLRVTQHSLVLGVPTVVLLVAVLTWLATGRALRPVEIMRTEVDHITSRGLHRRLATPPGTDEIARLADTMNAMLARVERSVDSQRNFVADASHELRNPLASLRAELEIALAQPDHANWQEVVQNALGDTRRIERLAHDLLLLARLDGSIVRHTPVDLSQLAADALRDHTLRPDLGGCNTTEAPVAVSGDPAQLRRLIGNLLDNAVLHARQRVDINVQQAGNNVKLTVRDDGVGVPQADRERIFHRFVRLDNARSRGSGGSGLGLTIAQDIATSHEGTLSVGDANPGAVFTLTLPLLSTSFSPTTADPRVENHPAPVVDR
jgi:signal transduction histidine kinase